MMSASHFAGVVTALLSTAIAGYWRFRIQGQAQSAALKILQAMEGRVGLTIKSSVPSY